MRLKHSTTFSACVYFILSCFTPLLCIPFHVWGQVEPNHALHAHNDYTHQQPLFGALKHGATSIEVDLHIFNDELIVSHVALGLKKKPKFEDLYLQPLDSLLRANSGRLFGRDRTQLTLMLDFKSNGERCYTLLQPLIQRYEQWFHPINHQIGSHRPIKLLISGNRPMSALLADSNAFCAIDGRFSDLPSNTNPELMPRISSGFSGSIKKQIKEWQTGADNTIFQALVEQAHSEGRKVRIWGAPDKPRYWKLFLDLGFDLINTDRPTKFSKFYRDYKSARQLITD